MNIYLGEHFDAFVRAQVATGRYANASEVIREALRRYEDDESKLAHLRALVQEAEEDIAAGREINIDDPRAYAASVRSRTRDRLTQQHSAGTERAAS